MTDAQAMAAVEATIARRVNAYGVTEPKSRYSGNDRSLVDLPGIKDVDTALSL